MFSKNATSKGAQTKLGPRVESYYHIYSLLHITFGVLHSAYNLLNAESSVCGSFSDEQFKCLLGKTFFEKILLSSFVDDFFTHSITVVHKTTALDIVEDPCYNNGNGGVEDGLKEIFGAFLQGLRQFSLQSELRKQVNSIMQQFLIVGAQLVKFFMIIVLGILCSKFHVLDQQGLMSLSRLVIRVVLPVMIFINTLTGAVREGILQSLIVIPIALALYMVQWLLATVCIRCFHLKGNRARVFKALVMFGNVGFMGNPLIIPLCPENGMLYISLFTIVDQALFWTLGIYYTQPEDKAAGAVSLKNLKNMLSPALVAITAALVMVLLELRLPAVVESGLETIGNASMPLSLIYIGGMLYFTEIRRVLHCGELYAEIVVKMVLIPLAIYAALHLARLPAELKTTMTLLAALPAISSVAMLSKQNGSDGDYAISAVMLTTVACLLTLPLVSLCMALIG